jgi:hypothetical protein
VKLSRPISALPKKSGVLACNVTRAALATPPAAGLKRLAAATAGSAV